VAEAAPLAEDSAAVAAVMAEAEAALVEFAVCPEFAE
jgi:hypothetical protein